MPSQMAQILNNYRQTMPEAGAGMREGVKGYIAQKALNAKARTEAEQKKFDNDLKTRADTRAQNKEGRERTVFEDEQKQKVMEKLLGPVSTAETEAEWAAAQEQGFIPKELTFDKREAFIMSTLNEKQRLDRQKEARAEREGKATRAETGRHNRAMEDNKRKGDGRGGLKATDERYINSTVAGLFDGTYDVSTGAIVIKDDANRKKALRIVSHAARLAKNDPNMTLSEAVSEAARRNGIDVGALTEPEPTVGGDPQTKDPLGWRQ